MVGDLRKNRREAGVRDRQHKVYIIAIHQRYLLWDLWRRLFPNTFKMRDPLIEADAMG